MIFYYCPRCGVVYCFTKEATFLRYCTNTPSDDRPCESRLIHLNNRTVRNNAQNTQYDKFVALAKEAKYTPAIHPYYIVERLIRLLDE